MKKPVAYRYKYDDEDTFWNYREDESLIISMVRVHHIKAEPLYSQEYVSALENDLNILSKEWVQVAMAVGNATQEIHSLKKILNEILDNDGSRKIYNATKLLLARDLAEEVLRNERK